jgi:hypothetical protein
VHALLKYFRNIIQIFVTRAVRDPAGSISTVLRARITVTLSAFADIILPGKVHIIRINLLKQTKSKKLNASWTEDN